MASNFQHRDSRRSSTHSSFRHFLASTAFQKRFSLQWVLVIPFLVQISAAVALTGYVSLRNGQEAVSTLAEDLITQTKELVNQHLDGYLSKPHQINQINANLIQQGIFASRDFDALSQHFWKQAQTYSDVSYIGFGLPNGEYVGAGDWYDDPGIEIDRTFADSTHFTYSSNGSGRPTAIIDQWNYYPNQEEWFVETAIAGKPRWVLSFEDVAEGVYIAATANRPIYEPDGDLIGILGVDLRITDISNFLRTLKPTQSSSIFILEREGTLLAASEPTAGIVATSSNTSHTDTEHTEDTDTPLSNSEQTSPEQASREDGNGGTDPETNESSDSLIPRAGERAEPTPAIRLNTPDPTFLDSPLESEERTPPQGSTEADADGDAASSESSPPSPADLRANQRYNILESSAPELQAIATALYDTNGKPINQSDQILSVMIDGDRHYLQVTPWQDDFGLDWRVVVVVPESEFMAQIQENTRHTLLLCLLALSVASVLGIFTSRWIARPILQINQAAEAIATGQLDQQVPSSQIHELATLSDSFNHMAEQVKMALSQYAQDNETLEERVKERTQELTQTLEELRQTQGQLVHNEKMSSLGQLVAGIAHELNNPINFIYGNLPYASVYTEQLLDLLNQYQTEYPHPPRSIQNLTEDIEFHFLQSDLPRLLNSLNVGASRIQEIIRSLRSFSRVDESTLKTVNIHEGIESTLMILNSRIKAQPHRGEIKIIRDYGEIPAIACSPGQLNQVVMNILSNAIDALETAVEKNPDLEPKICIRTYLDKARRTSGLLVRPSRQPHAFERVAKHHEDNSSPIPCETSSHSQCLATMTSEPSDQPNNHCDSDIQSENLTRCVTIAIADNGLGIPEHVRQRIFDPFFTTKPIGKGTGLGLSISHQIITEKHHGMLSCYSTPGHGTEFQIILPIHSESDGDFAKGFQP